MIDQENYNRDLRDYLVLVFRNKITFISFILFSVLFLYYLNKIKPPVYKSTTTVLIESESSGDLILGFNPNDSFDVNNELEILRSRLLAKNVFNALLISDKKNNLYTLGTREFKSQALNMNKKIKSFFKITDQVSEENDKKILRLKSKIISKIKKNITVQRKRDTNTLLISFSSPSADESAFIVNTIVEVYKKMDNKWKNTELVDLNKFLKKQIDQVADDLSEIESNIKSFQEKNNYLLSTFDLDKNSIDYQSIYVKTIAEKEIILNQINYLNGILDTSFSEMREEIQNTLSEQILNLRQILIEREALLISNNLDKNVIDALTNEVKILKKKLSREVDKLINDGVSHQNPITEAQNITREIFDLEIKKTQLESKEKEYKKLLDEYLFSRSMLPSKNMELQRLNRSKLIKEQLFTLLNTKYEETKITQISKSENIRVIDPAIGGFLVSPVMSQIYLLGIAIGTILAILFIFSYEYFDRTVKSPEQIQGIGLQLIGIIPLMSKGKNYVENLLRNNHQVDDKNNNQNDYQQRLITHNDPMNPVSESYRSIRTNISHADTNKDIQMVMVTSPSPSEGKTTNVLNIAISYAQLNKKTLVIDSDLRKPKIHKAFNLNREPGLSDILSDSVGYDDCISKTNIDNLYIIPSGKLFNNPSELLGSSNMKSFIKSIKKEFDIVIFDTPPVVAVTDARVYMSYIDATILIVKAGQTDLRLLKRASNMLRSVKSPMIGCILNGFSNKHSYYGDYYYYNQYYYTDEG